MTLKTGEWKMNQNGVEGPLTIITVDQATGLFGGSLAGASFTGVWDETSRTITFPGGFGVFKGFLSSTPRNPVPGQDVLWTLAGFVQITDLPTAIQNGGNARRTVFGWFAQITEVA